MRASYAGWLLVCARGAAGVPISHYHGGSTIRNTSASHSLLAPEADMFSAQANGQASWLVPTYSLSLLHADNTWVEVLRGASTCVGQSAEGLSPGQSWDHGEKYASFEPAAAAADGIWPYGCWFFLGPGSGVAVNVGKSLRVSTRKELHDKLAIPCGEGANGDPLDARHEHCADAGPPGDKLYCHRALKQGYDSIQIVNAFYDTNPNQPNLVICSGGCATQEVRGACPPVPMQDGAGKHCDCDNSRVEINCGADSFATRSSRAAAASPLPPRRRSTRWSVDSFWML